LQSDIGGGGQVAAGSGFGAVARRGIVHLLLLRNPGTVLCTAAGL